MKLRLSYSLLYEWSRGNIDGAIKTYFHMQREANKYMEDGRRIHKEIQDHIVKTNELPDWFFKYEFLEPENEKEVIVPYNDLFDIKILIDTYDCGTGFEYKTGVSDSLVWSRTAQIPMYFLVCELAKIPIDKFYLMRWNQYTKEKDFLIYWNSQKAQDYARNFIDSYGTEIHDHFTEQGLI